MSDRKVNWAIVGVGDIVRKRVGAAILRQPDSTLRACVEINPQERCAEIESLAPQKVYTYIDQMLADPLVDAVYVATPVHLHAPQTIAALRSGKDVLVEKPMACNTAEALEVCRVAAQTGRRLAVAYFRRFWPRFKLIKEMLDRGDLGQVVLVRFASHTWYAGKIGGWREKPELSSGGVLSDVGCHKFDLMAWWFGMPKRIVGCVETLTHGYFAEDSASLLMTLPGGAQVTGSFHWNSKTWADEIHIVGTEAKITLIPCDGNEMTITIGRDTEWRKIPNPENQHYPLIDDFTRSIVEDRQPQFTETDGINATQILDAIYDSSRRHTWVEIG